MSTYVIGIGGTGAKIVESLVHISAAGLIKEEEVINLFFIDADVANGNLNRTMQTRSYHDLTRRVEGAELNQMRISYKNDNKGNEISKWSILNGDINTLRKLFTTDFASQNASSKLLSVLYSPEELDEPLEKGFKGHPNIGSAVITKNLNLGQDPWNSLFNGINAEVTNHGNVKIIVCGSIFGGTGAAGIPTISKILYDRFKDNDLITLNAILMLPYFTFRKPEEKGLMAVADKFLENTKYALQYYHSEKYYDYYQKLYIVGDDTLNECPCSATGGDAQQNPAMMPELVAALAIKEIIRDGNQRKFVGYCTKTDNLWTALPITPDEKNKLIQYLLFSLHYVNVYYPRIKDFIQSREIPRSEAWALHYFKTRGIDIFDGNHLEVLSGVNTYCESFIRWADELFSAKEYRGHINTALFRNNTSKIKEMNDISYIMPGTRIDRSVCYDRVYKGMNSNRVNAPKAEIGLFFRDLYSMCEL